MFAVNLLEYMFLGVKLETKWNSFHGLTHDSLYLDEDVMWFVIILKHNQIQLWVSTCVTNLGSFTIFSFSQVLLSAKDPFGSLLDLERMKGTKVGKRWKLLKK